MNNTIRGALLFATAIIAFAVPARAGEENRPSMEACIAYAEAYIDYDGAMNAKLAAMRLANNEASDKRSEAAVKVGEAAGKRIDAYINYIKKNEATKSMKPPRKNLKLPRKNLKPL